MKTKETEVLETNVASGLIDRRPGDLKPWPGNVPANRGSSPILPGDKF